MMAITAHLEETQISEDRSREPRRKLRLEAQGELASGHTTEVTVHNVSATGLLIESALPLDVGERLTIDLPHAGSVTARVVWTSEALFGCEFDKPISTATLSAAQLRSAVVPEDSDSAPAAEHAPAAPLPIASDESFGMRLQRLRKQQGMSLAQIADRLGVSKPTVWAWERGKARPIDSRIDALAEALDVAAADIVPQRDRSDLHDLLARSREQIADAFGTAPEKVRIMIEL